MRAFSTLDGIAIPLDLENIDTDKILPARFLTTISRTGLGAGLLWSLRQDPDCLLNQAPWNEAGVLIAQDNLGCGSSREHAPWALLDFGISCVIAPSIADIFYNNCCKNGILPILFPKAIIERLLALTHNPATARLHIDLEAQSVRCADGTIYKFPIDPVRKADLLEGVDEIARSLTHADAITRFEKIAAQRSAWLPNTRQILQ